MEVGRESKRHELHDEVSFCFSPEPDKIVEKQIFLVHFPNQILLIIRRHLQAILCDTKYNPNIPKLVNDHRSVQFSS